jgi:hypothetical protein
MDRPAAMWPRAPKSIAESVSRNLRKFDGVRSLAEQVKHVACAQFAFFNEFEGKKPPEDCEKGGHDPARSKAELIKYLKDSFDYGKRVFPTLNEAEATTPKK